ncbi:uncharacterized protein ARMOST_15140 [Armillaria ostoyae]|uniref:Uncharacterized protein n=1 Tax=Armillaria ostoyae TaxID=47428 RepID=A0A284RSJ8_ARMOS|nr:uncharacterized protein ARMOST_15140 [Armillaria ostoyae]
MTGLEFVPFALVAFITAYAPACIIYHGYQCIPYMDGLDAMLLCDADVTGESVGGKDQGGELGCYGKEELWDSCRRSTQGHQTQRDLTVQIVSFVLSSITGLRPQLCANGQDVKGVEVPTIENIKISKVS